MLTDCHNGGLSWDVVGFLIGIIRKGYFLQLPSGKHHHNYGKSPFLMGKSTINGHVQ